MQNKFSRNFIIGVSSIITLMLLYFGINFLKGVNILKKQNTYVVMFDNVMGLNTSSPVYINGFQIGLVKGIKMHSSAPMKFAVSINLKEDYKIPKGSYFEFGADFLGNSQVNLIIDRESTSLLSMGDTLPGRQMTDMMKSAANIVPRADSIMVHIDSAVVTLNKLMANPMWTQSIEGISSAITQLDQFGKNVNGILVSLSKDLPAITQNLNSVSTDLKDVTDELNSLDYKKTFNTIDQTLENLKLLSSKLNNTDSSLGKLTNDTQLHDSLTNTIHTATKLLEDIRKNPERYLSVKVRLF